MNPALDRFAPSEIVVERRLRPVNQEKVARLAESIKEIGLKTPISVRIEDKTDIGEVPVLIAGLHRLEACRRLGWDMVPVMIHDGDERDARLWEIAENLHRAELTALEHDEHVAEWVRLTEEKVAQSAPPRGGRQPKEQGIRAASRELGIDRTAAQRAVKVDSLAPETKEAARDAGLDDNRTVLLAAAAHKSKEDQLRYMREETARRAAAEARKAASKETREVDHFIAKTEAEEFAQWLMARITLETSPQVHKWLLGAKGRDTSNALKRLENA